jgi:hypothetical protein
MDAYGDQLRGIAGIIERAGFHPAVRGVDKSRFVYAEHENRAVEVYCDEGGFLIEFFEEPAEYSVRESQHDTPEQAAERAVDWLLRLVDQKH